MIGFHKKSVFFHLESINLQISFYSINQDRVASLNYATGLSRICIWFPVTIIYLLLCVYVAAKGYGESGLTAW